MDDGPEDSSGSSLAEQHTLRHREGDEDALDLACKRWLSTLLEEPLPPDTPLTQLVANGVLLARVSAALLSASESGSRDLAGAPFTTCTHLLR